ncbi:PAS domain S-box protein [Desulforapulum autotrophicum]|nr:PAS domain S-box protein [Desulforapulum autotrophicum]
MVIILILFYVGTLLVNNYNSRIQLIDASRKRFVTVFEKQAMAMGYFFSEREQDLVALSGSREISTYFENKALGMSMQYGLGTSLLDMQHSFTTLADSKKIGEVKIYNWIAFVQSDGTPVTTVSPQVKKNIQRRFQQNLSLADNCMGTILEKRNNTTHAVITVPYFFKYRFMGYIVADVTLETAFHHLLDTWDVGDSSRIYLFCPKSKALFMAEDPVFGKWVSEHLAHEKKRSGFIQLKGLELGREKQVLVFSRVVHTPFFLIHIFPDDKFSSGINPRDALLIMVLLFLLVFGSVGFLIHSNTQKQLLAGQVEASRRNAREFQQQNDILFMEIAERKKMEKALEKANRELSQTSLTLNCILKSATEFAIAAIDSKSCIIHFNPAAERLFQVKREEIMGQHFSTLDFFSRVGNEQFYQILDIAQKQGKFEYDLIWKNSVDGGQLFRLVVMPMHNDDGINVGFILFVVDNTTRYRSEEKLRLSEERYRTLVENMPDIVFSIDENFLITTVNIPNSPSYSLEAGDIVGRSFEQFIHEQDRKQLQKLTRSDFREKKKYRRGVRFRFLSGAGKSSWVDLNLHYQYNNDGSFSGANGVLTNIAERKLLEAQLVRTERLAAAGQLAASIAHEINSPLAGISALLALVRKKNLNDKKAIEEIDLIRSAFESIGSTVKKLLNLNRPGLDYMQRANINAIVHDTVKLSEAYLKKKGIIARLELSECVPDFDCHPQDLGQVFLNFINNTIEAVESARGAGGDKFEILSCQNEILITTRVSADKIFVDYVDTGPGIAPEDLDKIFDPFFTTKKQLGMGFGLSICHEIILRHNGTLRALPRENGAWFAMEFSPVREV